jgi:lambda family phage portal protein
MRNPVDAIVEYCAPGIALKRYAARQTMRILNTGYSEGGASKRKNSMKGWTWRGGSTREDIDLNSDVLRQRSRNLYMTSPLARASLGRMQINVVGQGLKLRPVPDAEILGLSVDEINAWSRRVVREFALWANSKECDQQGLNNFDELQQLALLCWLHSGDAFALLPIKYTDRSPYGLRIQLIEADRIQNPGGSVTTTNPKFHDGVEVDEDGRVVAYHIRSNHPHGSGSGGAVWTSVPVRGATTGKLNIVHLIVCERAEQYRGVPLLAPVIESLKQLSRYSEAELMGAVVAAMYTVFIKSDTPDTPFGEAMSPEVAGEIPGDPNADYNYNLGTGAIVALNPGEEIQTANPGRPNAQFDAFVTAVSTEVSAALNIPAELVLLRFGQSYSASRAALLEAWKVFRMWRTWMAADFCQPIYEEWLTEAILLGRVNAPGYFDDPLIRAAWLRAQWNGPSAGQVNPVNEVKAAQMRVDYGFSTFAREAQEISGQDLDEVIQEQTMERQQLLDAGILQAPSTVSAVTTNDGVKI